MQTTSMNFFIFLATVLVLYYLLPRRFQNLWLLLASYVFYLSWAWEFALTLFLLTAANFYLAKQMHMEDGRKIGLLWLGISINLIALLFFRLSDFFLPGIANLFASLGLLTSVLMLKVLLPVGLAFYSLQNISYLIDVQRKQTKAADNFIDFALFLAYFPKLISGPIERARTFLPKLAEERRIDNQALARGFTLILSGLLRKLLIAGMVSGIIFWDAFETPEKYTGPELISWIILYGFFLYNDFAGYTSIARGISNLFGLELSQNFKQPYFARSMGEFWNSWHVSLSHWLRDYIYFPASRFLLKRNRDPRHALNLVLPPLLTMLVSGLWHGITWHMLLWGGLHGIYQAVERLLSLRGPVTPSDQQPVWRQVLAGAFVLTLITLAWVPFIMEPVVAGSYWRSMFDWTYPIIRFKRILLALPLFALVLTLDWLERRYQDEVIILRLPRWSRAFLLAASLFALLFLMQTSHQEPFIYQGF